MEDSSDIDQQFHTIPDLDYDLTEPLNSTVSELDHRREQSCIKNSLFFGVQDRHRLGSIDTDKERERERERGSQHFSELLPSENSESFLSFKGIDVDAVLVSVFQY